MKKLILILILCLSLPVIAQSPELKPIPITDEPTKKTLVDAYQVILAADKDFQIALLKARIKYKVDETWPIDLRTLTFVPPEKKEAKAKP